MCVSYMAKYPPHQYAVTEKLSHLLLKVGHDIYVQVYLSFILPFSSSKIEMVNEWRRNIVS